MYANGSLCICARFGMHVHRGARFSEMHPHYLFITADQINFQLHTSAIISFRLLLARQDKCAPQRVLGASMIRIISSMDADKRARTDSLIEMLMEIFNGCFYPESSVRIERQKSVMLEGSCNTDLVSSAL